MQCFIVKNIIQRHIAVCFPLCMFSSTLIVYVTLNSQNEGKWLRGKQENLFTDVSNPYPLGNIYKVYTLTNSYQENRVTVREKRHLWKNKSEEHERKITYYLLLRAVTVVLAAHVLRRTPCLYYNNSMQSTFLHVISIILRNITN